MQRNLCCLNCGVSFVREVKAMQPQSSQIFFHFFARFHLQYAPISRTFMTNFLTICFMGEMFIISFDLLFWNCTASLFMVRICHNMMCAVLRIEYIFSLYSFIISIAVVTKSKDIHSTLLETKTLF